MITGGRNIENMYFDLNKEFNYSDRDVWVKGTIVPKVRLSFEEYWKHKISERITDRDHYPGDEDYERAKSELTMSGADYGDYQRIMIVGRRNMEQMPIRECPITSYATDLPGATFRDRIKSNYKEKFRITERAFGKRLRMSKKVHISSPYFMMNTRSGKMMDDLYAKGVDMTILTNSLGATDATYVSAAFYRVMHDWADIGVQSYLHNSKFYNHGRYGIVYPEVMNARWGLHSKTQVYYYEDGTSGFMIGTYNIDNRSSFYNNEMAMFCDGSDELTADLQKDIDERMIYNGYKVIEKDLAEDHQGNRSREYYYGHAPEKKIRLMKNISIPVEVLQFLL
jgi:putative cardiolipin synthase